MAELSLRARLYLKINDNLSEDDVRTLRATLVTDGHLGQARVETATPLEIFNMLEADNKIGQGNLALLVDLLKAVGKTKLAQEAEDVAKREKTGGPSCTVDDVITCLKDLYATEYANIRPLPWCEELNLPLGEFYTNLQHQRRDCRGHFGDTNTVVSLADIYKRSRAKATSVNERPTVRRIRVEGDPGIGKSCSCQKLAHDWSSGKLDIFKAVFFLEIRHMSGKVKDAIFEQLLPEDTNMTPDQLWSYIQENQDDVLFILDGLDELSHTARENTDVEALIKGKILRNCHVLVTSRPYHCVKDLEKCHEFYKIIGYSEDDSVEFIQKYFSQNPESAKKLETQLRRNRNLSRIVVNPLNNVLICIVWEDNDGRLPSSQAELYQMIVYSVAKRYCAKKDIPLEGDVIPSNIEEALRGLGKLSWEGLEQDQLQFNIADIREKYGANADDMLDIGLLTRDNSFSRINRTCFCAFLHKTFQEYLAAYYISELVKQESKREEGRECLRSLFGMTEATASNVDMHLMSTNRLRYNKVQNMLAAILGDSPGPLFDMFAEELSKDGCKEEMDYLSFICVMFLGRTCGDGKTGCRMAEIVAPCLSQHISNHRMGIRYYSDYDQAAWIDGLIQVIRCQRPMNHDPSLIRHLTIDCDVCDVLPQQPLHTLEDALSCCDTINCVTLKRQGLGRSLVFRSGRHTFSPIRTFIPRRGTESVHIDFLSTQASGFLSVESMLEELSEKQSLQHVNIDIECNVDSTDFSQYDKQLAYMVLKLSCLRSLQVTIGKWVCEPEGAEGFGNLTATLQSISEHRTLEVVELEHPVYNTLCDMSDDQCDRLESFDVDAMIHKLTKCVAKSKILKRFRLSWLFLEGSIPYTICYGICSRQSLSDLCLAIQRNRTLKTLTIDGMFSESEGHQEIIDQLMRNKPANFQELRITMFNFEQYTQRISTAWPRCRSDSSGSCHSIASSSSEEPEITMFNSEQYAQYIPDTSPRCNSDSGSSSDCDSISDEPGFKMFHSEQQAQQRTSADSPSCNSIKREQRHTNPSTSSRVSEHRDDLRFRLSGKHGNLGKRSPSSENVRTRKKAK